MSRVLGPLTLLAVLFCIASPAAAQSPVMPVDPQAMMTCIDGVDNDADGRSDVDDPDCLSFMGGESTPNPPKVCEDGKDNDADGSVDMLDDGCSVSTDENEGDGERDIARAKALLPKLTRYGSPLVRIPLPKRVMVFQVHCQRAPCTVALTAEAHVKRNGRNARIRSLDDTDGARNPIRVTEPTKGTTYAVWFSPSDFPAGTLKRAVKRYRTVRLRTTAVLTDATGAATTAERTINVRAKAKPRPKRKPKPRTVTDRAEDAVASELSRAYEISYPDVDCDRMTSTYFVCPWRGLSRMDVQQGNVDGWSGKARVHRYGSRFDVTLGVENAGY